jgi:hypothetical protein
MHGIKSDEQKRMQEIVSKNIRTRCKLNLWQNKIDATDMI